MTFLTKTARCLALGAFFIGAGLSATAQTVTPASGSATCQVSPTATGLSYSFSTTTGTFSYWSTKGDLQITSSTTANPVTVQSTGFGRGQIIANYSVGGCTPIPVPYEVNKAFTTSEPIVGPTCVLPNGTYTWSINPIISKADQIAAQIGIDRYTWTVTSSNTNTYNSLTSQLAQVGQYSGDFSAIRLVMPSDVGAFTLQVQVGACNLPGPTITVTPTPPTPAISGPSCRPTSDVTPFTLTTTSQPGVLYTWNVPPTWTISPANATTGITATGSTLSVTVTPDANGGDVTVTASNGGACGSPTAKYTLKRQLDPGVAQITNAPACFTIGTDVTLGVSPVANNSTFTWTIPTGFIAVSGTPGTVPGTVVTPGPFITVRATGSASGTISVTSDGCGSGVVSKVLRVNGNNGCSYALSDLGCGTIRLRSTSGTGCLPAGTSYTWSSPSNPPVTVTTNTYTFPNGLSNETATVSISNTSNCLSATTTGVFNSSPSDCGNRASGGRVTKGDLSIYPNPTGGKLNVDLPLKVGEQAKLTVLDMAGRTMTQSTMKEARGNVDVSRLPEGVYMLHAQLPNGKVLTQKVIVRHESNVPSTDLR